MDWTALLQNLGLPTVAVVALAYACWKLLLRMLNNADADRTIFKESMVKITDSMSDLSSSMDKHEQSDTAQHGKILESLERIERRN